jgi:endonuclease/exonuclease/phosphatase family metal-dependent hydrolase
VRSIAAVLALALAQPQPVPVAATTETLTVWQWNVAGWVLNAGSTTNGMVDAAVDSILYREADFAVFNEICWNQYTAIRDRLGAAGWPRTNNYYRFAPALRYRCAGESFGNAIFSRRPLGATNWFSLAIAPQDGGETRNLLCAAVLETKLRLCGTHLSNHHEVAVQAEQVRGYVEAWEDAGETVLVAGDFNSEPGGEQLAPWSARHRELDGLSAACPGYGDATTYRTEGGACGTGPRIDLIFATADKIVGSYYADSLGVVTTCGGPCSDHRIVHGRVTVRIG